MTTPLLPPDWLAREVEAMQISPFSPYPVEQLRSRAVERVVDPIVEAPRRLVEVDYTEIERRIVSAIGTYLVEPDDQGDMVATLVHELPHPKLYPGKVLMGHIAVYVREVTTQGKPDNLRPVGTMPGNANWFVGQRVSLPVTRPNSARVATSTEATMNDHVTAIVSTANVKRKGRVTALHDGWQGEHLCLILEDGRDAYRINGFLPLRSFAPASPSKSGKKKRRA